MPTLESLEQSRRVAVGRRGPICLFPEIDLAPLEVHGLLRSPSFSLPVAHGHELMLSFLDTGDPGG